MKRLLVAIVAAGGLAIGLAAVATGPAQATVRPHTTPGPTLVLSQSANLTTAVTIKASGANWPPDNLIALAECNSDGATPDFESNACKILTTTTTTKSGTFEKSGVAVADGELSPSYGANSGCPQTNEQAHDGVQCIFAADDLTAGNTTTPQFAPIFFKLPTISVTAKPAKLVDGKRTYSLTISLTDAYEPTAKGSTTNNAGFEVIGTYKSGGKTITGGCQGTTSPGVTWGVGLPACTGSTGEKVKVEMGSTGSQVLGTLTAHTANTVAGDLKHTFKGLTGSGPHIIRLIGETSGQLYKVIVDFKS